jgi:DNA polymerase alpha subunit A
LEGNGDYEYDDADFIVDDDGNACNYGEDEEEDDLHIEKKKAKKEAGHIMNFISKMAASSNAQQIKPKPTLKPKENTDKFMKNLLNDLDDDEEEKPSSTNKNNLQFTSGVSSLNNMNNLNSNTNSSSGFNFNNFSATINANRGISKPYGMNPNFLPEFEKKLTTKTNQYENEKHLSNNNFNDDVEMENANEPQVTHHIPQPSSNDLNSLHNIKSEFIPVGREIKTNTPLNNNNSKRTREELNQSNKSTNDMILQHRTPVTANKTVANIAPNSNQTEYYTPNSRIPEITGRTPVQRTPLAQGETYTTPIKTNLNGELNSINGSGAYTPHSEFNQNLNNISITNSDSSISMRNNLKEKLPTLPDGSLKIYWYDAIEDQIQTKPAVIFFGKIYDPATESFQSISIIIKNIMRSLYIYPKTKDMFAVYKEFENLRSTKFSYIKDYVSKTVKKKYCFELPIPHGEHEVIKIKYLADMGTIPANLQGETFEYIFGRNSSLLEKILLSRKIKGPCWLKLKSFDQPTSLRHTFCKYEVILNDYKQMEVETETVPHPPLKLMSVSIKTVNNQGTNEIFAITATMKDNYYIENEKGNNDVTQTQHLVILRKYDQSLFTSKNSNVPMINIRYEDIEKYFKEKYGKEFFLYGQNETVIINQFVNRLHGFDPDIIVGHNLYTGHMELFFNRITRLKINNWAKIGKFRRDVLPKFLQNSNLGNFYVRSCMVGRLICDTSLSCRDILRENNYSLSFLSEKHLKEILPEIDTNVFLSASRPETILRDLGDLLDNSVREANLALQLMDKLAILPLSKQLTNIAGNLWIKSLQNSRADRCEMFLMHEFNKNRYLLPDKVNKGEKFEDNMNEEKEVDEKTGKKKPQYSGGLVLEPKIGLYDTIVLLLDFNSLYPTIIQEFNICFTTVIRKPTQAFNYYEEKRNRSKKKKAAAEGSNNIDPSDENQNQDEEEFDLDVRSSVVQGKDKAILPLMLESLVLKRKAIKDHIKKEKDKFKLSMLDIKQKAIKLSANSLYGYLGYKNSRFYAKSIAALVTATGRSILQDTVNLVTNKHELSIIYGDTDSIMINTGITDINQALQLGNNVKYSVKERYKLLEMEVDGVFKTLLLLKKKKYAYLKFEPPYSNNSKFIADYKGLDLVRRDWCEISKQAGFHILDIILSNRTKEEIIHLIFDFLKDLGHKMDNDGFMVNDYEITKQLTKNVDDYADAKALPHVKVAKRLKEKGDQTIKQNAYIPYVVCIDSSPDSNSGNSGSNSKGLADKCYHPKEIESNPNLKLDITWYKENQIIASVSRLCKHIEEIDMYQLATCLGIDGSKYTYTLHKNKDGNEMQNDIIMEEDAVVKCFAREGVNVKCNSCGVEKKINKITDKNTSVMTLLQCEAVRKIIYII